jgi:hypothetical protein
MDFDTLILNAQKALDAIAGHDDFAQLLELGLWDDPAITLSDARQSLEDLQKIYQSSKEAQCLTAQN